MGESGFAPNPSVELSQWQAATSLPLETTLAFEQEGERSPEATNNGNDDIIVQQLQRADGGPAAWKLLITAFIFEALLWGEIPCCIKP
jgi:hypothetical protein